MDFRNDITLEEEHTIVYGHRMKDGSMFAGLNQYLEPEFYQEHPGTNIVQGETVEYLASNTEYLQQANPDVLD